ncbi:MAG: hypothetical protein NTV39_01525 [Candidatus Saccharibacteria bacterium]|nr:hypothetical protein [Candidatus Saccharibacteria bacterium]
MRKYLTVFFLISSLLIILDSIHFGYALMMFFFAGIIPGTNLQLTPEEMLILYVIAAGIVVIRFKPELLIKINLLIAKQSKAKTRKLKRV